MGKNKARTLARKHIRSTGQNGRGHRKGRRPITKAQTFIAEEQTLVCSPACGELSRPQAVTEAACARRSRPLRPSGTPPPQTGEDIAEVSR
ncbi:hypothetical protein GCM10011367_04310 [Marinicauda pacifica]|nr:hypothetical protein GCM10011367_04310 [Marinicauda pacifica]